MELEFYAIFIYLFLNLIRHNSILNQASFSLKLDFTKIEFRNRGTNLYSFKIGTYCQIFNTPKKKKNKWKGIKV